MISRRLGIVVIAAGTAATLAVIGACNDLSAPRPRPQPAAPIARNWDAPDHPSGFFTPDPLYGGFADSTTLVSHFPEQTAVYIIGAGKIVKHDRAGVLGDASYNAASVTISETFPNGTSQILQFPNNNQQASDTIPFTMQPGTSLIKVSRASWSASNLTITNLYWNGRWINCSPTTTPCYTFD